MTTEDDFQAALDANPDDHHTRLVFADWLDDHDDPRGPGYRALGVLRKRAMRCVQPGTPESDPDNVDFIFGRDEVVGSVSPVGRWDDCLLPLDWFKQMMGRSLGYDRRDNGAESAWFFLPTRRQSEDAAAHAFARLPAVRRAELLQRVVV